MNDTTLEKARRCRATAEGMTGDELKAWYEREINPRAASYWQRVTPAELTALVAGEMFWRACDARGEMTDDEAENQLFAAILYGGPL